MYGYKHAIACIKLVYLFAEKSTGMYNGVTAYTSAQMTERKDDVSKLKKLIRSDDLDYSGHLRHFLRVTCRSHGVQV